MATTSIAVGTMRSAQIAKAGGGFEIVEREIPSPGGIGRSRGDFRSSKNLKRTGTTVVRIPRGREVRLSDKWTLAHLLPTSNALTARKHKNAGKPAVTVRDAVQNVKLFQQMGSPKVFQP